MGQTRKLKKTNPFWPLRSRTGSKRLPKSSRRRFWPPKYFKGLTKKQRDKRAKEIAKFKRIGYKSRRAYVPWKTDKYIKTKRSAYTTQWQTLFPNAKSLKAKAKATGVPLKYIQESYDRGKAAWTTGHRPGATAEQWGYARVHSFLLCGKTYETTDADLARKAKAESASARAWWKGQCGEKENKKGLE